MASAYPGKSRARVSSAGVSCTAGAALTGTVYGSVCCANTISGTTRPTAAAIPTSRARSLGRSTRPPGAVAQPEQGPQQLGREPDVEEGADDGPHPVAVLALGAVQQPVRHGHQVQGDDVQHRHDPAQRR